MGKKRKREGTFVAKHEVEIKGRQPNYSTELIVPILFKSRDVIVVDKPFDVHIDGPLPVTIEKLMNSQHGDMLESDETGERRKFKFCHQLDYSTSGVMTLAVTKASCARVATCFQLRTAQKIYIAVILGHLDVDKVKNGPLHIRTMIGEQTTDMRGFRMCCVEESDKLAIENTNAKLGETDCSVIKWGYYRQKQQKKDGDESEQEYKVIPVTKVRLKPSTGRRHQLRLHMRHIGHPICGDATYAEDRISHRMMLHAWKLTLPVDLEQEDFERPRKYKKSKKKSANDGQNKTAEKSTTFEAPDPFEGDLFCWTDVN